MELCKTGINNGRRHFGRKLVDVDANGDGWIVMGSDAFYDTFPTKKQKDLLREYYPSIDSTSLDSIIQPAFKVWKNDKVAIKTGFYNIEDGIPVKYKQTTDFEFNQIAKLSKNGKIYKTCPHKK